MVLQPVLYNDFVDIDLREAEPVLKWAGGKRQLLPELSKRYPKSLKQGKITKYIEPFMGGGAVFFDVVKIFPTIHSNGTPKARLLDDTCGILAKLREAREEIQTHGPNMRDYYPQGDSAWKDALADHLGNLKVLDEMIRGDVHPPPRAAEFVNIEYRTPAGALMDLGPFVHASLRNGQGAAVELTHGYFKVAPGRVHAGMSCVITTDGGMHERVQVKVDNVHGGTLYVQSQYSASEFLERINAPPAE